MCQHFLRLMKKKGRKGYDDEKTVMTYPNQCSSQRVCFEFVILRTFLSVVRTRNL